MPQARPDRPGGSGGTARAARQGGTGGAAGAAERPAAGGAISSCTTPPAASALVGLGLGLGDGRHHHDRRRQRHAADGDDRSALASAAGGTSAAVIYVNGVLSAGKIKVGSNKTIVGLCGAEIHGHLNLGGSSNVIIRNIKIVGYGVGNCALDPDYDSSVGCSSGNDAVTVNSASHHLWFDHCDISDGTDGNLDITIGSDFVTVSWTKFHYTSRSDNNGSDSTGASGHRFSNLIGADDGLAIDVGHLNVTWHHDWWADNVVQRMPRARAGKIHLFNNLFTATGNSYCTNAGDGAHLLVESNVYNGVKAPLQPDSNGDMLAKNNVFTNTSGTTTANGTGFSPTYSYTRGRGERNRRPPSRQERAPNEEPPTDVDRLRHAHVRGLRQQRDQLERRLRQRRLQRHRRQRRQRRCDRNRRRHRNGRRRRHGRRDRDGRRRGDGRRRAATGGCRPPPGAPPEPAARREAQELGHARHRRHHRNRRRRSGRQARHRRRQRNGRNPCHRRHRPERAARPARAAPPEPGTPRQRQLGLSRP